MKLFWTLVGFVLGLTIASGIEICLVWLLEAVFDTRLLPRGAGWLVIPVLSGIAVARVLPALALSGLHKEWLDRLGIHGRLIRFMIAGSTSWLLGCGAYVLFWSPYGSSISGREWEELAKLLFVPPLVGVAVVLLFGWAMRQR